MPGFHFPIKRFPITGISRQVHNLHHQDSPQKNPNESGTYELLVTCYPPFHDNDAVDQSQHAHSLLNDVFQKVITNLLK